MALLLALSTMGAPAAAWADEVDDAEAAVADAQAVLSSAQASLDEITAEYETLASEIDELQAQIDEASAEVMKAQESMLAGRESLGDIARGEYRSDSAVSMLSLLLESSSFEELMQNMEYVGHIMDYQTEQIEEQEQRCAHFEEVSTDLSAKKDEQEQLLGELADKKAEAERVVSNAASSLSGAQAEYESQLAALQAQAAQFEQQEQTGDGPAIDADANTVDREEAVSGNTPVTPNPDPDPPASSGGSGGSGGSSSTSGWLTGSASAYGGSSDPYTPNPGTTATGAVCDDNSMGVAIPMSMPNYRSYFGRTVEISYGGRTVYAVVNDCGGLLGGARVLDLQPGVFKALGFNTCQEWGVRTVSYRFL